MSNGVKILLGALAGAAAGIVTGVLLAPASGKDTRDKICEKTEELLESFKELLHTKEAEKKKTESGK